jgi:hypothetical protein
VYFAARREDDGTFNKEADGSAASGSSARPGPNGPDLKTLLKNANL